MQDFDYREPRDFPSTIKSFDDVLIGEDCETFDGKKGVVLEKGTLDEFYDGSDIVKEVLESDEFSGDEPAIKVQLEILDEPSVYLYGEEYCFVRKVFREYDF